MPRFAIYDLDRTITRLPTWSRFLLFAARRRSPLRLALVPLLAVPAGLKLLGAIDRTALKQSMHRLMLGHAIPVADLTALAEAFAAREITTNIRANARASIAADIAAGCRIVVATAANRFYAAAVIAQMGVDDLIATENATDAAGRILSDIAGDNCYGEAKACAIERWVAAVALVGAHVRFYSDHISDLPAFAFADEAVAINPDKRLRAIAAERGWKVLDWG